MDQLLELGHFITWTLEHKNRHFNTHTFLHYYFVLGSCVVKIGTEKMFSTILKVLQVFQVSLVSLVA